jgi:hypothetical protein
MDPIGLLCDPEHPIFGPVSERLVARGFDVTFFRPTDPISPDDIESLSAIANGVLHPTTIGALRHADKVGVPSWNGFTATAVLSARLVMLSALESVGCTVPNVRFDGPTEGYIPSGRYAWDESSQLNDSAPCYIEQVREDDVDIRYYAVDDGLETHVRASKLRFHPTPDESAVERTDVDVSLAAAVREVLELLESRAAAVDFTRGAGGTPYALWATPVPSFTGVNMERRVADSVASLTTIG